MTNLETYQWDTYCEECGDKVTADIPPIGEDNITWAIYKCNRCGHAGKKKLLRNANNIFTEAEPVPPMD